jgi:hypothetical protein
MVVEGVGTLCSVESGVQTPSRARSPSPCTDKVEKGNLEAPAAAAAHAFWGEGGHGAWGMGHGLNMAQQGHNMASTRPNMQNGELAFLLKIS